MCLVFSSAKNLICSYMVIIVVSCFCCCYCRVKYSRLGRGVGFKNERRLYIDIWLIHQAMSTLSSILCVCVTVYIYMCVYVCFLIHINKRELRRNTKSSINSRACHLALLSSWQTYFFHDRKISLVEKKRAKIS